MTYGQLLRPRHVESRPWTEHRPCYSFTRAGVIFLVGILG